MCYCLACAIQVHIKKGYADEILKTQPDSLNNNSAHLTFDSSIVAYEKKLESKLEEEEKNSEEYGYGGLDESENVIMMDDEFEDSRPGSSGPSPVKSNQNLQRKMVSFIISYFS